MSESWNYVTANPYTIDSLKILLDSGLLESGCRINQEERDLIQGCVVAGLIFRAAVDIYTDVFRGLNIYDGMDVVINLVRARFNEARNHKFLKYNYGEYGGCARISISIISGKCDREKNCGYHG